MATDLLTRKPVHNKKYYCVTGEAYKCMLMSSKTIKGKATRKYYIKIENLAMVMKEYTLKQQIQIEEQKFQMQLQIKDQEFDLLLQLYF